MKTSRLIFGAFLALSFVFGGAACKKEHTQHTLVEVAATAATCTTEGNVHYYQCSDCNKTFSDPEGKNEITSLTIAATGHKMTKNEGKDADCENGGVIVHYSCEKCGELFADEQGNTPISNTDIPPLGHKLKKVTAKDADCKTMSNGNIEHYICENGCSKKFVAVAESSINAKQYTTTDGETIFAIEKQPSDLIVFAEHSYEGNICVRCRHEKSESSEGLLYELSVDGSYYTVSGIGTCNDSIVFISGEYNGKPVKEVKAKAFEGASGVQAFVFFEGATLGTYVEKIGDNAFEGCSALKNVFISGGSNHVSDLYGILEIGNDAFKDCTDVVITYEGSQEEWKRIRGTDNLSVATIVFKSYEIIVPIS